MRIGTCAIAGLMAATSALAHHSNSAFDGDKVVVLTGTITEWKWTNPHVWIFLSVNDSNGGKVQWEIEGRTPGQLVRAGWSKTTLTVGETVTVDFSPARDGSHTGLTTRVTLADGTVLSNAPPDTRKLPYGCVTLKGTEVSVPLRALPPTPLLTQ